MAPFRADFEGQPKYDDSKPRQSRRAAAPAAGSRTLDDLDRCRVFRPLIDHLVDNAPLHCHFPSQEVVALERVLDLLERLAGVLIHVGINGVAHGSTCLRSAAWDRRRESAMLLRNRNTFGHAFIKDIAGNAGDKPLQPTFPDQGGRLRSLLFFTLRPHRPKTRHQKWLSEYRKTGRHRSHCLARQGQPNTSPKWNSTEAEATPKARCDQEKSRVPSASRNRIFRWMRAVAV